MSESFDHIIFVGFKKPSDDDNGERTIVRIMNAANVDRRKIHFFDGKATPQEIIRGSFIPDKSQRFGYQIGNSLCIGSSAIGARRHTIEKLTKVGIEVRTGYQDVDHSSMSESDISRWLQSGKFEKISTAQPNSGGASQKSDSLIDDILMGFDDDDSSAKYTSDDTTSTSEQDQTPAFNHTDTPVDTTSTTGVEVQDDTTDVNHHDEGAGGGAQDDILDGFDLGNSSDDYTGGDTEGSDAGAGDDDTPAAGEQQVYDAEIVDEEQQAPHDDSHQPEDDDDELIDSFFRESGDNVMGFKEFMGKVEESTGGGINEEDMGVFPVYPDAVEDEEPEDSPVSDGDNLKDVEEYRRKSNVQSSTMGGGDDLDYINQAMENRKRAEKRRRKKEEQERKEAQEEKKKSLAGLENLGGYAAGRSMGASEKTIKTDRESSDMVRQAEAMSEETHNDDGVRKNYYQYMSPSNQRDQVIAENVQKEFGSIKEANLTHGTVDFSDSKYVGKGTGRIILCTAGKGGVGKSLVSNGMASALALARAKELHDNPGASTARTWLIESDYNSPQLAAAYKTKNKHLGNVAATLAASNGLDNDLLRETIEDNVFVDPETGVHVLACPPLNARTKNVKIPYAISLAVKYASDNGDDVIIDHGNLTTGEYSTLDKVLAMDLAHRVVIVCNMGCIPETQSALSILTEREIGSSVAPRKAQSISVVLNSAREEQFYIAQEQLKPFGIMGIIQPIDALRAENSLRGDTYLNSAPQEVRKNIIDRCGLLLTKLGYSSMLKYFSVKSFSAPKTKGKKSWIRKLSDKIAGDS